MKILVIEDDRSISELIEIQLSISGYDVVTASNGKEGLEKLSKDIDLVILDIMMPVMNGYEVLEHIKETPTIILSAKDQLDDKMKGFHLGADDYLAKPFELMELLMRVKAVLKRNRPIRLYEKFGVKVDFENRIVLKGDRHINLTLKEYDLLSYLIENEGMALSRDCLLENVWDFAFAGSSRTVDIHIQKLRKKLEIPIETVYKYGYRLESI